MNKYWLLILWSSILVHTLSMIFLLEKLVGNLAWILPVLSLSIFIAIPSVLITRLPSSNGGHFVLVSTITSLLSFLMAVLLAISFERFLGISVLGLVGAVICWTFCYTYDRIFLDKHYSPLSIVYLAVGFVAFFLIIRMSERGDNRVMPLLIWNFTIGLCITFSIWRHMETTKPVHGKS